MFVVCGKKVKDQLKLGYTPIIQAFNDFCAMLNLVTLDFTIKRIIMRIYFFTLMKKHLYDLLFNVLKYCGWHIYIETMFNNSVANDLKTLSEKWEYY